MPARKAKNARTSAQTQRDHDRRVAQVAQALKEGKVVESKIDPALLPLVHEIAQKAGIPRAKDVAKLRGQK